LPAEKFADRKRGMARVSQFGYFCLEIFLFPLFPNNESVPPEAKPDGFLPNGSRTPGNSRSN
jgi:hypothetical protein